MVLEVAREEDVCRRLMTVPGVGAVVALTFMAAIECPARFAKSRSAGAILGMGPRKHQSGGSEARSALFEAAHVMLAPGEEVVGAEGVGNAHRATPGNKRAMVALARKMAVILHRMWVDGTTFQPSPAPSRAPTAATSCFPTGGKAACGPRSACPESESP